MSVNVSLQYSSLRDYGWRETNFLGLSHFFFGVSCAIAVFSAAFSSGTSLPLGKNAVFSLSVDRAMSRPFMWIT